jgi:hypothetical protein
MTKKELIKRLLDDESDLDTVVVIGDFPGKAGWSNIDDVRTDGFMVRLDLEENPVFHDN